MAESIQFSTGDNSVPTVDRQLVADPSQPRNSNENCDSNLVRALQDLRDEYNPGWRSRPLPN